MSETTGLASLPSMSTCYNLSEIYIPDSVNVIEEEAFDSCVQIKDVKISSNVTSIGRKAFARCSNLRMIDMPDSVKTIGDECFFDCVNLYNIKRLGSITELGRHTFYKCGWNNCNSNQCY